MTQYDEFLQIISENSGVTTIENRKNFAAKAFGVSSHYDSAIFNYLNTDETVFRQSFDKSATLRYGENPHQKGFFFGDIEALFDKLDRKSVV